MQATLHLEMVSPPPSPQAPLHPPRVPALTTPRPSFLVPRHSSNPDVPAEVRRTCPKDLRHPPQTEASRPPRRCPPEPGTCTNPPKRPRDLAAVGDRRHSARLRRMTAVIVVLRRHPPQLRHSARPPGHARGRERSCQKTDRRRAQTCPQRERRQAATPALDHNRGRRPHQAEDWPREHPVCREQCSSKVRIGAPSGGHSRQQHRSNSERSMSTSQQGNTLEEEALGARRVG